MLKNEGKLLPPFRLFAIKISNLFEQNLKSIKKSLLNTVHFQDFKDLQSLTYR